MTFWNITSKFISRFKGRAAVSQYNPIKKGIIDLNCSIEEFSITPGTVHGDFGPVCGQSIPQDSNRDIGSQCAGQEVHSLLCGRHGG